MLSESFWKDTILAKQKQKELSSLKKDVEVCHSAKRIFADIEADIDILKTCEDDDFENDLDSRVIWSWKSNPNGKGLSWKDSVVRHMGVRVPPLPQNFLW